MSVNGLRATSEIQDPNYYFQTDQATHFTGAIAVNAVENESLLVLPVPSVMIQNVAITSIQNLPWAIWLWGTSAFGGLVSSQFMGVISFGVADGRRIGGAGAYYYDTRYNAGLLLGNNQFPIPYYSTSGPTAGPGWINMSLQVQGGAVAKLAAGPGAVEVKIFYTPMGE